MLPVVDKPVIQYVVEEAVESGIENIIIVTGSNKRAIEDHFDAPNEDLTRIFYRGIRNICLKRSKISDMANSSMFGKRTLGNGTPVLAAEPIIENEPFAVLWGDEFIYAKPPRLAQMLPVHEKYGGIVISGVRIDKKKT